MNSAAVTGTAPGQRVWQRSGLQAGSGWVLVGDVGDNAVLPGPPIDRVSGTTSHRSTRRPAAGSRRRARGDQPGWLWMIRWYRARWAGRRALRSR
ncbi:hypothetical protein [Pseudonocardia hierapolitana]|uniref:hypothetical protein n=1 Tax=Pseudonocardia hierapolitana TaxID=1128676 RepID=UPI0011BDE64A|nr:hypothetical protein [Pseudonocardia hierapolitana]